MLENASPPPRTSRPSRSRDIEFILIVTDLSAPGICHRYYKDMSMTRVSTYIIVTTERQAAISPMFAATRRCCVAGGAQRLAACSVACLRHFILPAMLSLLMFSIAGIRQLWRRYAFTRRPLFRDAARCWHEPLSLFTPDYARARAPYIMRDMKSRQRFNEPTAPYECLFTPLPRVQAAAQCHRRVVCAVRSSL